ncbi:MAG: hypothetical protein LBH19_15980, partial [Dysgonamonadaceae bacterium]|nr:hypothetical protein [Dysgonamonadaceae bacterium]
FQHIVVAKNIVDMCALSSQTKETGYIFPLYLYQENFGQSEKVVNMNAAIGQNFPPLSFGEGQGVR